MLGFIPNLPVCAFPQKIQDTAIKAYQDFQRDSRPKRGNLLSFKKLSVLNVKNYQHFYLSYLLLSVYIIKAYKFNTLALSLA